MPDNNEFVTSKALLKKLKTVKTIPAVAIRVTQMIEDENSTFHDFEEVIKLDPTLVMRVLRHVNSPFYALRTKVTSIAEAVCYIGIDNIRNLIVIDALKTLFITEGSEELFSRTRLWMHSVAVGICSQMISERIFGKKGENAFLSGILHDIGLILEDQAVPDEFYKVCKAYRSASKKSITLSERLVLETDHTFTGLVFAKEWHLPSDIQDGIKRHHDIFTDVDPMSIPAVIQIANYLVSRIGYNVFIDIKEELSQPLLVHMKDNITAYKLLASDLPDFIQIAEKIFCLEEEDSFD